MQVHIVQTHGAVARAIGHIGDLQVASRDVACSVVTDLSTSIHIERNGRVIGGPDGTIEPDARPCNGLHQDIATFSCIRRAADQGVVACAHTEIVRTTAAHSDGRAVCRAHFGAVIDVHANTRSARGNTSDLDGARCTSNHRIAN